MLASIKISILFTFLLFFFSSCNGQDSIRNRQLVKEVSLVDQKVEDIIQVTMDGILDGDALPDSVMIRYPGIIQDVYRINAEKPIWSANARFLPITDSLLKIIDESKKHALFPDDYYKKELTDMRNLLSDTLNKSIRLDASKWAYADLLFTNSFIQLCKDLKVGRLIADTLYLKDSTYGGIYFSKELERFKSTNTQHFISSLEPGNKDYKDLIKGLESFLKKASFKKYTIINTKDSLQLPKMVYNRLAEEDSLKIKKLKSPDSLTIASAIKKYQKLKKLPVSGRISTELVRQLNNNDLDKFYRIAITLDRYKLTKNFPDEYVRVNIPSYYLQVRKNDTIVFTSKIICGRPENYTPLINSNITDMITYPQWTVPPGIIKKEILPALKRNPGYLGRKGLMLVDYKGNEISPYSVNWEKYKTGIPYNVVQGSGDANALGVLKFNFPNKYFVYLHDTNQRYLFSKSNRALSHGCVRVQEWKKLAYYLLKRDSLYSDKSTSVTDLEKWLNQKKKQQVIIRKQMPILIEYYTCEGKDGKVIFYDDIYGDDKVLRDRYFSHK